MRVGLVCAHATPPDRPAAGTRQHVAAVASELAGRGHDVRVYERRDRPDQPPKADAEGYLVERAPIGPYRPAPTGELVPHIPELSRWLADRWSDGWQPDVVHGHFWIGGLAAASAVRRTEIPVVQTFHSLGAEQLRHLGPAYSGPGERIPLERALTRAVDLAIAQSSDEVDELTRLGLQRSAVAVVPPAVDVASFSPQGYAQPRGRRSRVLAVSGLEPGHGLDDLIQAMRLAGEAELVIVGGPPADRLTEHPQVRRLAALAQRCHVGEHVRFVGAVAHEQMPAWYRSADVVACTSRYACAGRVPVEAMACGVPVVGYALGGVADTIVDEVTGWLVAPGDVRGLGVALRRVLGDDAQRFAYAHAAVDRVRCSFTWERVVGTLERLYERAVRQRVVAA